MPSKNSAAGRKAVVKWREGGPLHWAVSLPTVLDREKNYYEQRVAVGEPEIDKAVRTWFKLYHSLVWLVATTNQNCYVINAPYNGHVACDDCPENPLTAGEPNCLKKSHLVPAFSPEESGCAEGDPTCHEIEFAPLVNVEIEVGNDQVGNEVRRGWVFEDLKHEFEDRMTEASLKSFGMFFPTNIYQMVGTRTLLQRFLNKFKKLPSSFDAAACLQNCLESRSEMGFAPDSKKNIYIDNALNLIKDLWAKQELESHLDEMKAWVTASSSHPAGSKEWLQAQLNLASIEARINTLFSGNNLEAQKKVSLWTAVLEINIKTFTHTYNRFVMDSDEIDHGLEAVIKNLATGTSAEDDWNNLLFASYGAVAWQIFHQASLAVNQVP